MGRLIPINNEGAKMSIEEAKALADKILNCGHNNSLTCWKPCKDCKNNFDHNDVIKLAKWVKEQK